DLPMLPDVAALLARLRAGVRDVVFVQHPALDLLTGQLREAELVSLLSYPARLWLAVNLPPGLPVALGAPSGGYMLVPLVSDGLVTSRNLTKRMFDLALAAWLLVMLAPVLAGIALLVRASGPGVLFRQERIGAQGRRFMVLKFRTMTNRPGDGFTQAVPGDLRVTRIGRVLRRSSLDELPQLWNVLRGEMSLVGPRPHAPETMVEGVGFEQAVRLYRLRHRVRPGMTGLAQIRGQRGETRELRALEQRVASDLEYIRSWSLWLDLSILVSTLPQLWRAQNAH
ncbi:MAG: sugar transferase, partial [Acidocella sp.]|nr:sugar transferase [Acidocella sp.]